MYIEGLFRGPPAAHGYDTAEVRKMKEAKVGTMAGKFKGGSLNNCIIISLELS